MDLVRNVVKSAGRRLFVNDLFQALAVCLCIAIGVLLLTRLVERVLGLTTFFGPLWQWIFIGAGAAVAIAAVTWATIIRRRTMQVAQEVDERADLRESLSTALAMEKDIRAQQPWAVAMAETATAAASRVKVPVVVPYQLPPAWPAPILAGVAMAVIWFAVPNFDLLNHDKPRIAQKEKEREVLAVKTELAKDKEKLNELLSKAKVEMMEGKGDEQIPEQSQKENDPEAIKRAAIRELTDLTNKLEDAKVSEKAMQSEAIKEALEQLKQPGPGPLNEFAKSLQKGDFSKAQDAMEQITKDLANNKMSAEDKAKLKEQLDKMGQQLKELSKDQKQLEKKLQDAGLDKKTAEKLAKAASDPAKLQEEISKTPGLNPEMKNEMMKMARAAQQAGEQCQQMGESMSKMSEGMSQEGLNQQGSEAGDQLQQSLSEGEMMQSDMENLEAAMDEAKDQLSKLGQDMQKMGKKGGKDGQPGQCDGEGESEGSGKLGDWRAGDSSKQGQGSGGPGQGEGADGPQSQETDYVLEKKKADVKTRKGPVIGSRLVYGEQVKGEALAEFGEAVSAGEQTMSEGIEGMRVPRELEGAVKQYFGRLKSKADEVKKK
jgi:hypothetical protein